MPLRADASSFVPGQSFQFNPSAQPFQPIRISSGRNTAAKKIQSRFRGNNARRNLTQKKKLSRGNRPIDYNVQEKIMNRYILHDDLEDLQEKKK